MINLIFILLISLSWAVDVKVRSECNVANSDCIMTDQIQAAQSAEETLKGNARQLGETKRNFIKSVCDSMYSGYKDTCGEQVFNEYSVRIKAAQDKIKNYQQQSADAKKANTGEAESFKQKISDLIAKYEEAKTELNLVIEHQSDRLQQCLKSANKIGQSCVPPRLVPAGNDSGDSSSVMAETWSETFSNIANKASSMAEEIVSPVVQVPEVQEQNGTAVATAGMIQSETIDAPEIVEVREKAIQTYNTVEDQSSTRSQGVSGDVQQIDTTVAGLRTLLNSFGQNTQCSGFTTSDCESGGDPQVQTQARDSATTEDTNKEQALTRTGGDPTAKKTTTNSTFIDPTNTGPSTTGKSELGSNTPTTTPSTSDTLSKTGTTTTTPTSSSGGFLSSLGSMFGGGATPTDSSYDSGSYGSSYDDGSGSSSYYNQNSNGNLSMEDSNYGSVNGRYNNNNANMKMTPEQQRQAMLNGGNYGNGNQQGGGSNNTGFGQFGNSNNNNNAKNKVNTNRNNSSGNKQVFSSRNANSGGVTGGIFGASKKDQNFNRRIASLKAQGGKDAVFDPNKYNPSMKAQAHAMARGTGRISGKMGTMASCSNTQGKIQTIPGACDIRVHVGTADVFRVISPSVKLQLGQEI